MFRNFLFIALGMAATTLLAVDAEATTVTLDFETAATGNNIVSDGSVSTAIGTVSLTTCDGTCAVITSVRGNDYFYHQQSPNQESDFAEFSFSFAVSMLSFDYVGDNAGAFTAQAIDKNGDIVDTFLDPSTSEGLISDSIDGTVTLTGSGIVAFRFSKLSLSKFRR